MTTFENPPSIHEPVASYSHQARGQGGRWLVLSGQVGMLPDGTVPTDPVEQVRVALDNIGANLEAADMTTKDVVKLTIYLAADMDAAQRRQRLDAWLDGHRPTMTLVRVAGLATPDLAVEIEAMAVSD